MLKIILPVVIGVLLLLIITVVVVNLREKRKNNKLDENIKKLKDESEKLEKSGTLTLTDELGQTNVEPVVLEEEQKGNELPEKSFDKLVNSEDDDDEDLEEFFKTFDENFEKKSKRPKFKGNVEDDDFEKFLDSHSYTRRILDKSLLKKIQQLPPDVKALVISSIFTRPQD